MFKQMAEICIQAAGPSTSPSTRTGPAFCPHSSGFSLSLSGCLSLSLWLSVCLSLAVSVCVCVCTAVCVCVYCSVCECVCTAVCVCVYCLSPAIILSVLLTTASAVCCLTLH